MFIPPGENIVETKKCRISGEEFVVTDRDLEFYDTLSPVFAGQKCAISSPTLCPRERQIRRMVWRNYDQLYKSTCSLTGKEIVSTYKPGTPYKVASLESWWSDSWNPCDYGQSIDFSRPFFPQFHELDQRVIHMPSSVSKSENSIFTNFSINNRNCYLSFRVAECEECYYDLLIVRSRYCFDCYDVTDSEYLYECVHTAKSYHSFYCTNCENCQECYFLRDCSGCEDCFGSCNLRNARFVFNNIQLTEVEYRVKKQQALKNLGDANQVRANFLRFSEKFPKRYMTGYSNENVTGDFLFSNKNVVFWFECKDSDNLRYAHGTIHANDCIDFSFGYFCDKSLEVCGVVWWYGQLFCVNNINDGANLLYSKDCANATIDCFGCISLNKGRNCILNRSFSQHEYEENVGKLIAHMCSTGEWWEFFPAEMSPYDYNESAAHTHFPLSREEVESRGLGWYESPSEAMIEKFIPLTIYQYDERIVGYEKAKSNIDTLLSATLLCLTTGKKYKILPQELSYYLENSLPIPLHHPIVRSQIRMGQALPMELHNRTCAECWQAISTSYAPNRPETVLCDICYQKLVY